MIYLRFKYTNWKHEEHTYVIEPEVGKNAVSQLRENGFGTPRWMLSGTVITRDGETRGEQLQRRSFKIVGMRDIEEVAKEA